MSLIVKGPCCDCGSAGRVPVGPLPHYRRGELIVPTRPCPRCAARTALAFLLVRIGSWTQARWDQHVRDEYGDEVADVLEEILKDADIPIAEFAESRVSAAGAAGSGGP